jgi:hypothetical protein
LQKLIKAIYVLRQNEYEKIILVTDHGFVLNPKFTPGDNAPKPSGEWIMKKSRSLAGKGDTGDYSIRFTPSQIGVKSDVSDFLFLKNYAVFEKNTNYFHEGISLQENVVPVMVLSMIKTKIERKFELSLTYKGKTIGSITTRRPLIELASFIEGELGLDAYSLRIEALANDKIIGIPAPAEKVNELSKLVEVFPGQSCKIPLEMEENFEGKFEVRVSDPVTNKTLASINLETDYIS